MAGGGASTLGRPTACGFVYCKRWGPPSFSSPIERRLPCIPISHLCSLPTTRYSLPLSVSPNYKFPANSFHPLHFPVSRSNDKTTVLYLDSNPIPCYHSVCFPYGKPARASPFPPEVPIHALRPPETFKPFNIPTFQCSAKVSAHRSPLLL